MSLTYTQYALRTLGYVYNIYFVASTSIAGVDLFIARDELAQKQLRPQ